MKSKKESEDVSVKPGRKSTTLWLCIVFFASAWMFVLGVLVGRGTAPVHFDIESLQKELSGLKEAVQKKEQEWYRNRSDTAAEKPELEFHEALKKNRVDLQVSPNPDRPDEPAQNLKKFPVPQIKKSAESKPEAVKSIEEKKLAAADNQTAGNFTIQVAALKEARFADLKVAELSRKGYPAYRTVGTASGQESWYRVRIGSFKGRTEASQMLEQLKRDNIKGIIVQK